MGFAIEAGIVIIIALIEDCSGRARGFGYLVLTLTLSEGSPFVVQDKSCTLEQQVGLEQFHTFPNTQEPIHIYKHHYSEEMHG